VYENKIYCRIPGLFTTVITALTNDTPDTNKTIIVNAVRTLEPIVVDGILSELGLAKCLCYYQIFYSTGSE